jgi:hypothetical protein
LETLDICETFILAQCLEPKHLLCLLHVLKLLDTTLFRCIANFRRTQLPNYSDENFLLHGTGAIILPPLASNSDRVGLASDYVHLRMHCHSAVRGAAVLRVRVAPAGVFLGKILPFREIGFCT